MLEFKNLDLRFGSVTVLSGINLELKQGQRMGLLGPSGVGKSTLLRLASGLLKPSSGQLHNGYRNPLLVFQEPRLLPWRRVQENIEIPLRAAGYSASAASSHALHWLNQVDLGGVAQSWPGELSGGMAQRVSLARAFALQPDLLLLDEPFSALDPALRASLSALCRRYLDSTGAALLCISHHPHELMELTDSCLLLTHGKAERFDSDPAAGAAGRRQVADQLHQRLLEQEDAPS